MLDLREVVGAAADRDADADPRFFFFGGGGVRALVGERRGE